MLVKNRPISITFLEEKKIFNSDKKEGPFSDILHVLVMMVLDLSAATMKLRDVLAVTKAPDFADFVLFLQLTEVYGGGYLDDVDQVKFHNRANETHRETMIKELQRLLEAYDLALFTLDCQ